MDKPKWTSMPTVRTVVGVAIIGLSLAARAQSPDACATQPAEEPGPLGWLSAWKKAKADLEKSTGTSVCLVGITTNQTVLNGRGEGKNRTVFWWNLNVTQKLWQGAKLVTNARGGDGDGLLGIDGSKHNTNWMRDEPRMLYVSHLYLQQKLLDDRLSVNAGKLDLGDYFDTNEFANWDFLSYSLARNPTIPFTWHAIGGVVRADPTDWLYVQAGAADAQGSWTETGLNTAFHDEDYFIDMYEAGLRPKFYGRQGNYRFLLWHDPRPTGRVDGNGTERGDFGFAVSFDQEITEKLGLFLRYGHADDRVREAADYWSAGALWKGPFRQRPKDHVALGVGQMVFGDDFRQANSSSATETIFETYYKFRLTDWCSLSPDLQVILNPGARSDSDVGVVAGLRLAVEF